MENTNRTLALLLVAAIVVSLGGTMISLDKLGQISVTGKATDSGTATLTVTATYIVTLDDATIDFGSGSLTGGYDDCRIYSNNTHVPSGCNSGWTVAAGDQKFEWSNTGSAAFDLTIKSNATAAQFVAGGRPELAFRCESDAACVACDDSDSETGFVDFTVNETYYNCSNAVHPTTGDNGTTWMFVNVSSGGSTEAHSGLATITFSAAAPA